MNKLLIYTTALFLMASSAFANEDRSGTTVSVVASYTLTNGGSGGTNGTFAFTSSGGTCTTQPAGTFTVVAHAVTSLTFTTQGVCSVVPTASFSASTNLVSTNITFNLDKLYVVPQNSQRRGFYVFNPNATDDCWGRFTSDTINSPASVNGLGSFIFPHTTGFVFGSYPPKEALSVECATAGDKITVWEVQSQ